ncbi:MAG: thioredoxin-disulfide reductase [Roseburia sp.]|nr:thioredoxin-disulfide reductase [Roseburia sp.]MCM1277737.1 thioredoxin-disulfide reductase [Robinsoniella sp.]
MDKAYDVIIIGAGPAGMSAAVYGIRAGLSILVLEKSGMAGGQILNTYEVENYLGFSSISGFELGTKFKEHGENLGVTVKSGTVKKVIDQGKYKLVETEEGNYVGKALILATGASHAKLMVQGEEELTGMGVSYCATCDGAFFKNRTVAVVGGSDVAVEDAIFLARGCEKVYLIHRRDKLRAAKRLQEALLKLPNVEILWNTTVEQIQGEDMVEALSIYNKETKAKTVLKVSGVFIAVGMNPNTELFKGLVDMDEKGYIQAGETCETSHPGIFAAGDLRTKHLRQIVTAVADGASAIASSEKYLMTL